MGFRIFSVYKVVNCVNRDSTAKVLVGKLGKLRCENCSDNNVTILSVRGLAIIGTGNRVGGLRTGVGGRPPCKGLKVNRAE